MLLLIKSLESAQKVAAEVGCDVCTDYHDLLGKVEAVSIVVPTDLHYEIAADFLQHNTHVLVEKPITTTIEQAE